MPLTPVKSSNIEALYYDDKTRLLTVKFKSGAMHDYHGVHPDTWLGLQAADSVGKYFHANIRNAHKSSKHEV